MAYGESNGHVTDDITWPRKVKLVTPECLEPNISKTAGDGHSVSNYKVHPQFEVVRFLWIFFNPSLLLRPFTSSRRLWVWAFLPIYSLALTDMYTLLQVRVGCIICGEAVSEGALVRLTVASLTCTSRTADRVVR